MADVAAYTGLSNEDVIEALEVARTRAIRPLEPGVGDDDEAPYDRHLGADDPGYAQVEELVSIAPAFRALPRREREILRLRFGHELTQREIARRLGISQMHVSRLIRRALDAIGEHVGTDAVKAA